MGVVLSAYSQKVGINKPDPQYELDVNGFSASANQISIIPLWQNGVPYSMSNTDGIDLSNCESALIPTAYSSDGNIEVKLVIRIQSTSATTNNFQLRAHNGTTESYPILFSDNWNFQSAQTGFVAQSPWKQWSAGTSAQEIHLHGWVNSGTTNFTSAYLMVRPRRS